MSACDKIRSKGKTFYALRRSYIATIYELCAQNIRFDNEKAQKVVYAARAALLRLQHWSSDSLSFHPGLCHPAHGDPLHRTPLRRRESPALPPVWVPLEDISRHLPMAVIASEDNRFAEHHGFDFDAIQQAIDERREGKRRRGASTISQQTAKNLSLIHI